MPCNIRATARSEIGCPVLVNAAARLRVDLVVHTSNDIGSPRVAGSTNALSATVNSGSVSASFLRPPPGARTRTDGAATPSTSRTPRAMVSGCTPVACATALIPPRPSCAASTPRVDSSKRSAWTGSLPHSRRSVWLRVSSRMIRVRGSLCRMELTMAIRKAITRAQAVKYRSESRTGKSDILDAVCEMTGFNRDYARRALRTALTPRVVKPRAPRAPKYDGKVVAALEKCWAVLNAPAGKRLAPMLAELVPLLRRHRELDLDDATALLLVGMSPATIDRRLVAARSKLLVRGRSHTKPGSMLKSRFEMRTWADHDEKTPGFVEIDLVGHEGGNPRGKFCFTLTVTDIATGWTENRTVASKAQAHVFAALTDVVEHLPFPVKGIDSDNGSEFINDQQLRYCQNKKLKFTRSRSGNKNDGAHVEQKNWTTVRQLVGYLRYDTEAELLLLNRIWVLQSLLGNHFYPQQKLTSKVRDGAKITKRYDSAQAPYARTTAHPDVKPLPRRRLVAQHASFNPAAVQRQIQALCDQLLTLATAKNQPTAKPTIAGTAATRTFPDEATKRGSRTY